MLSFTGTSSTPVDMRQHYQSLRDVSRTFALSIEQLPAGLRDSITIAYLLFRVSDALEDQPELPAHEKSSLLRLWVEVLEGRQPVEHLTAALSGLDEADPEVRVARSAGDILQALHALPAEVERAILQRLGRSSLGMARWQDHGPYVENEDALDDYMHQVAGRVGYLLTDIFAWYSPIVRERKSMLMPLSRECGLALQTVNIIRGMRKDYERGWVYVPQSYYERVGLTRDSMFDPANFDQSLQVVEMLAQKAERHLWGGMEYVIHLPRRLHSVRLACMWPVYFAVGTLAVSRNNASVLSSEAKLGRQQVMEIMASTRLLGWSNHWLRFYYWLLNRRTRETSRSPLSLVPSPL
jgi:farnesyl-diphosphate farnesyltransferase